MSRFFLSLIILLVPLGSAAQLIAAPDHAGPQPCKELAKNRKSVGLVLEGGVALGLAHVGVLRWLEQNRIPVDCIAGTSMGGLIGVLYSMGYSPQAPGKEQKECSAKDQKDCPRNMETFLKGLLDQDHWESVFYDLIDYRDLSFSRKVDRRSYPNSFRFRLNRSIHLPEGIVPGHRVGLVFDDLAWPYSRVQSFNDLPVPFRCVATDLKRRQSDVLGTDVFSADVGAQGRLTEALRATMSLPVYFSPVDLEVAAATGKVEHKSYVDGGVLKNLPVSALKDLGADVIIAVHLSLRGQSGQCLDTGTPATAAAGSSERSLFDALTDTLSVVTSANEQRSIRELVALPQQNGLCVNVDVSGFEPTDFDRWSQLISRGFQAPEQTHGFTDRVLTGESKLSLDEKEYQEYQDAVKARLEKQFQSTAHPSYVTIETAPTASPNANENPDPDIAEWVRRSLSCSVMQKDHHYECPRYVPGRFAEKQAHALEKQLTRMVGTGRFSRLGYHMLTTDDSTGKPPITHVAITAENSDYTGAEVQPIISVDGSDYESPVFALGARFTAFDYGFAGSEWRGEAVLGSRYGVNTQYQIPLLGPASHWFIAPGAIAESFPYNVYHDQDELARYQLRTISGTLDMGYNFGSTAQLRVGYEGGGAKLSQKLGAMIFPFTSGRTGTTSLKFSLDLLRFSLDKLEAPVVPHNGIAVNSIFQWHDAWLGASDHFASAAARLEAFKSVSRSGSFYLKADGGSSLGYVNNGLPLFSFGTPLRLAAYGSNELRTNQYAYGGVGYVHRIYQFKALGGAIYATGSFEMAKVYGVPGAPDLPRDGVAGVILNSIVGPLYLAGTLGNAGHKKFFFYMGKIF